MTSPPSGDPPGPPPGTPPPPPPGPPPATGPPRAAGPPPGSRPAAPSATTPGPREQVQRRTYIILASLLILLLGVGALVFALTRGSDKPVARGPGEVFLQPAAATGPNPFTATVAAAISPSPHPSVSPSASPSPSPAPSPSSSQGGPTVIHTMSGGTPGLYGGTNQLGACDPSLLVRYLQANPQKAQAWVTALNADPSLSWSGGHSVRVDQIPAFVAELTPVVLRSDTRVTNNGFVNGNPDPYQAILQRGTAVLVDKYGVPRSRCACGNPLGSPSPAQTTPTYTGSPWPTFSPTTVVVVQPAPVIINIFVLTDDNDGTAFGRPAGSTGTTDVLPSPSPSLTPPPNLNLGSGDVQITLLWTSDSDLDLHVIDPAGNEIYFSNPSSSTGGRLDHDEVPGCGSAAATHAENVFWAAGPAPSGQYKAFVNNYEPCSTSSDYQLTVKSGGQVVSNTTGTIPNASDSKSDPVIFNRP